MRVITKDSKKLSPKKYYAVRYADQAGMIVRERYERGPFHVLCFEEVTNGNMWDFFSSRHLSTVVRALVDKGFGVTEFSSYKEMLKFLSL